MSLFTRGFVAALPFLLGLMPFSIVCALGVRAAGFSPEQTIVMSLAVYAGASQLAVAQLLGAGAGTLALLLATLAVNIRFALFSGAGVAHVGHESAPVRAGAAFVLVEPSVGLALREAGTGRAVSTAYFFGSSLCLYVGWQVGTVLGVVAGGALPDLSRLGLDLVFPLCFTTFLLPLLKGRPAWAAALVGGALALGLRSVVPGSWYLILAALGGGLAGAALEGRR